MDGASLAESIIRLTDDVEAVLALYEDQLFPRAAVGARLSADCLVRSLGGDPSGSVIELFGALPLRKPDVEC